MGLLFGFGGRRSREHQLVLRSLLLLVLRVLVQAVVHVDFEVLPAIEVRFVLSRKRRKTLAR